MSTSYSTSTSTTSKEGNRRYRPYRRSLAVQVKANSQTQEDRNRPPKETDIIETYNLFDDFCVPHPTNIPNFSTYADLEHWRTSYIQSCLRTHNYTEEASKNQNYDYKKSRLLQKEKKEKKKKQSQSYFVYKEA